ncbi:holin-like protein [Evansella caseinilytica]|uniref:Holin-like protein n=1 Tax=Evansella caseinilytica TaxID=1503961 RepID=A0A1H3U0A7_9BACI|nr:CidA/LrgA family protein [Evansella caseinilytica]SDZ55900.1 holin-like protein [Evansella caseinilytica]
MRDITIVTCQIALLWLLNRIGYLLVEATGAPVPGNVVGMLLLLLLLMTRILPLSFIEKGAGLLIKHLGFFFIPFAVGLMTMGEMFIRYGLSFFIIILISILTGMYVTGRITQGLRGKKERSSVEHDRHPA